MFTNCKTVKIYFYYGCALRCVALRLNAFNALQCALQRVEAQHYWRFYSKRNATQKR